MYLLHTLRINTEDTKDKIKDMRKDIYVIQT